MKIADHQTNLFFSGYVPDTYILLKQYFNSLSIKLSRKNYTDNILLSKIANLMLHYEDRDIRALWNNC